MKRTNTTTIIWEIAITAAGYEILRDGTSVRAVDGDIEEARSAVEELIAAAAKTAPPASAPSLASA